MPLSSQRHLFDIPEDVTYLNCAYMSPLMNRVAEAGVNGVRAKCHPWKITAPDFFTFSEQARSLFARLVGARSEDIAIIPSVSYGIGTAAQNISIQAGSTIICLEDQFPSNIYSWRNLARDANAGVRMIMRDEARTLDGSYDWSAAVLAAIGERTSLVALPHCHWTDGALLDLEAVGRKARYHGAALALDITQSAGVMPFDVRTVQPDFVVSGCYKWLLGPYSLGFLYVAPKWQQGRPLEENWIARAGSQDFTRLVEYRDDYQPGARRFDMGERSSFHLMPMAIAALEQILAWDPLELSRCLALLTGDIVQRGAELGLSAQADHLRAPHFTGLSFPGGVPEGLADELAAQKIYVSVRGSSMRVTPHIYNSEEDIVTLFAALARVLSSRNMASVT